MQKLRFHTFWLAIAWALVAVVTVLSLLPAPDMPDFGFSDKIQHALAYFALMAAFGQIYGARRRLILLLLGMGGLIEILQGLSGYRDMSFFDWVADAAGIAVGILLTRLAPGILVRAESWLP